MSEKTIEEEAEEMYRDIKHRVFKNSIVPWGQRLASLMLIQRRLTDWMISDMDVEYPNE